MSDKARVAVMVSGTGTNLQALIDAQKSGLIEKGEIVQVPLEEAASKTKFLPVDHPLIQTARDAGVEFGD